MDVAVLSTDEVTPGSMVGVEADGEEIMIANVNGTYYAIGDICTHMGCSLSKGMLNGVSVSCPCHSATFDVRSGMVLAGSASEAVRSFPITVKGDKIVITV